ncbi:hypothetical protein RchiOBHm_Chr2g0176651 [Rosa chinensis]|uniref:Uncharacterized protein n=1 Tax=Rosa chinensis TaxID=74649 RepID=A0A2P6S6S0_ROSCH|nr:hypothetical protein RchiOBHm_Chr2g0176651 [Rosa chinensis]
MLASCSCFVVAQVLSCRFFLCRTNSFEQFSHVFLVLYITSIMYDNIIISKAMELTQWYGCIIVSY